MTRSIDKDLDHLHDRVNTLIAALKQERLHNQHLSERIDQLETQKNQLVLQLGQARQRLDGLIVEWFPEAKDELAVQGSENGGR